MEYVRIAIFLLSAALLAAAGFFVMRRLDRFLAENRRRLAQEERESAGELRIALESPAIAPCICESMEVFSEIHPECRLCFLSGTAEQLQQELAAGRIDLGLFFSVPEEAGSESFQISLPLRSTPSDALGCSIEPLTPGQNRVFVLGDLRRAPLSDLLCLLKGEKN